MISHSKYEQLYHISMIYPSINEMIKQVLNCTRISVKSKNLLYSSLYYRIYLQTTDPNIQHGCIQHINRLIGNVSNINNNKLINNNQMH